jgi:hypothetical protein
MPRQCYDPASLALAFGGGGRRRVAAHGAVGAGLDFGRVVAVEGCPEGEERAVAQTVGFGLGRSKMNYLSMVID